MKWYKTIPNNVFIHMIDTAKFYVDKFDFSQICDNPSILIIGGRKTGKSFLIREILRNMNMSNAIISMPYDILNNKNSVSKCYDASFYESLPNLLVNCNTEPAETLVKKILERQSLLMRGNIPISSTALVLHNFNGCMKNENIVELLMNNRHYKLTSIVSKQTPLGFSSDILKNFDYVFLLNTCDKISIKKLWQDYDSSCSTFNDFLSVFERCTRNYGAMVIINRIPSNNIFEKIFWYNTDNNIDTVIHTDESDVTNEDDVPNSNTYVTDTIVDVHENSLSSNNSNMIVTESNNKPIQINFSFNMSFTFGN